MQHGKLYSYLEGKCRCDECCEVGRAYFREYRRAHPRTAYNAKYRSEHIEAIKAREAQYRSENKAALYAYGVAYKQLKKDVLAAKAASAESKRKRRIISQARRARQRNQFVENVDPAVVFASHHGRCGICGRFVAKLAFHVDHVIPIARGGEHSYANVQLAHPRCNQRKGARV